ncbi:kinesin-domain-containing protein [Phaffia rhodozyma]|uniref:Kinesin-domain-containing protein n=1 Tax=Phaffia rhodozyma TaxID=264483 RepID=A0A0F7SZ60_PHARH|nr:kinesin-domain-containing protein [Phaffia rhodozyma]
MAPTGQTPVQTRSSSRLRQQPPLAGSRTTAAPSGSTMKTTATAGGASSRKASVVPSSAGKPPPTPTASIRGRAPWGSRQATTVGSEKKVEPSFGHLPRQVSSSSTFTMSSTPSKPSMASKFLTAANASVRKMAPALSRLGVHSSSAGTASLKDGDLEKIKSFLRIRPAPDGAIDTAVPYLSTTSDNEVIMTAPQDLSRMHIMPKPAQAYTFTRVFQPEVGQQEYFKATALPLVQNLLNGENGLVFAYGVTNSGKSYTIQGTPSARGVVPRTLDVVFNSIDGAQSKTKLRPSMLGGVELEEGQVEDLLKDDRAGSNAEEGDDTTLKIDRNFTYAVFISYCEIYNEKIYDLLEDPQPSTSTIPRTHPGIAESHSSMYLAGVKRKALGLKSDSEGGGKYVSGMREIRVRSREEAQEIITQGQINRQVFGTLANSVSSRSHGVFTIKLIRIHNGAPLDTSSMQTARLSIVDLAGSERTKNTGNTGDRLKEAGNINKSLMVLGQCMEVLHSNQQRIASGRKPAMVPFRHSKLTEMFQNYFAGDGRAVMMIHVNPFDTGFEENINVMKFSAVARDVGTITHSAGHRFTLKKLDGFPSSSLSSPAPNRLRPAIPSFTQPTLSSTLSSSNTAESTGRGSVRSSTTRISSVGQTQKPSTVSGRVLAVPISGPMGAARVAEMREKEKEREREKSSERVRVKTEEEAVEELITEIPPEEKEVEQGLMDVAEEEELIEPIAMIEEEQIEEEDEEQEEETDDEDEPDALVEHLFDVIKDLRVKVFELELRCASIETETRDELAKDMQKRISDMERMFAQRLMQGTTNNEILKNKQIDIVQRSVMKPRVQRFATPETEDDQESEDSELEDSMAHDGSSFLEDALSDPDSPTPALSGGIILGKKIPSAPNFGTLDDDNDDDDDEVDSKNRSADVGEISLASIKLDDSKTTTDVPAISSPDTTPLKSTRGNPRASSTSPAVRSSPLKRSKKIIFSEDEGEEEGGEETVLSADDVQLPSPKQQQQHLGLPSELPGSPEYIEPIKKKKRKLGGKKILTEEEIRDLQSKTLDVGDIKRKTK